ncbi:MAG: glycosyltransferase [Candidatus Lokiarchaeota archaeon]|nr:glycosyltransferase [Candidatus Lokiarchaeota archaeon]
MNITLFGTIFITPFVKSLEKAGHNVSFNIFNKDSDILISDGHFHVYKILRIMKEIKKNKIKLVNVLLDIPPWRLDNEYKGNTFLRHNKQMIYHLLHSNKIIHKGIVSSIYKLEEKNYLQKLSNLEKILINTVQNNRTFYQYNYRNFLKKQDLRISISKFTKFIIKKLLKIESKVWYIGVNSDSILNIKKPEIMEYDAINISRIVPHKNQIIFIKAAKSLGLKIAIIGPYLDKNIILDCPHYYFPKYEDVMKILSRSRFYVDPSKFEGFGLTPIEAIFLDKPVIVSDIPTHREILGDYPLYFKTNDQFDLIEKMNLVINDNFVPNKNALKEIKKFYSLNAATKRLIAHLESIL